MAVLVMSAFVSLQEMVLFDTGMDVIDINIRCAECISHFVKHFVGDLKDLCLVIEWFSGIYTSNIKIFMLKWK